MVVPEESTKVSGLNELFNFLFQSLTFLSGMSVVWWYQHCFLRSTLLGFATFLGGGINSALSASPRILPLFAVRGVYLENRLPRSPWLSLRLSPRWPVRPWRSFFILAFLPTSLGSDLIAKLPEFLQLHELSNSLPTFIQAGG